MSDFYRHTVSRVTADGQETVQFEVPGQPSGLGWLPDRSPVVVSMKTHEVLRWDGSSLSTYADLSEHCGGHLNDLVVSGTGHVFAGDFGYDLMGGGAVPTAALKRIDPDGTVSVAPTACSSPTDRSPPRTATPSSSGSPSATATPRPIARPTCR